MKYKPPQLIKVKQFCRSCKNMQLFKVKKKFFINRYCLKCMACRSKIKYPNRFNVMKQYIFKHNNKEFILDRNASATPIIIYIACILGVGGLYTLFFLEIGFPFFEGFIPASDAATLIMTILYAIPLIVLIVVTVGVIKTGLKRMVV